MVLLLVFIFTGCSKGSDELTLFKRKIGRVDLIYQRVDQYDMDTTISQLISMEERTKAYNFSDGTKVAYQTTFITIPATLIYTFGDGGGLDSIQYEFTFSEDNAPQEIADVYEECAKFFDYPDEGYMKDIYGHIDESPVIIWIKNNAQIKLNYWMGEDLVPKASLDYRRSDWSGTSVAVFKLPFSPHALGDSIASVVTAETKKNSTTTNSVVRYTYTPEGETLMTVDYVFYGETLQSVDMELAADVSNSQQMRNLSSHIVAFMRDEFRGSYVDDQTDRDAFDIRFSGEATEISMMSNKDSGSRDILVHVDLYPYVS